MLTIIRKDLLLTINDNVIPAMGSSDVPVKFVNDAETYAGFLIEPRIGYYVNGCPKSTVCEYSNDTIKIPAEAFKQRGVLVIAIALIDNKDSNHIEVTKELALEVTPAPNGTVILPATDTWQTAVNNLVEQLYNQDYKPQFDEIEENLHNLVREAQNQQNKANNQQTQIDNAIDVMGDYEIVQDNPTQIRFKKGDGTYGDTVNLGDNLASKSMVNAGYDTYSGNSYSGSASDYGIEIGKASGNYKQVTTKGYQLFDASKLHTKSAGGATVTNNGDGSFTISGTSLTAGFNTTYVYSNELTKKILKTGILNFKVDVATNPRPRMVIWSSSNKALLVLNNSSTGVTSTGGIITEEIMEEVNNNGAYISIDFYASYPSQTIQTGTCKPMFYIDGDGTWERFTGGEPSPNPSYPCEPKFFEPREIESISKNMIDIKDRASGTTLGITSSVTDGTITARGTSTGNGDISLVFNNKIMIYKNKTYSFSVDGDFNTNNTNIFIKRGDLSSFQLIGHLSTNRKSLSFTPDSDYYVSNILIRVPNTVTINGSFKIQLEEGKVATPYIDFKGQDTTPLDIILRALPNGVRDTYKNNIITRRIGVVTFDGSDDEKWTNPTVLGNIIRFQLPKQDSTLTGYCLCNKFKNIIDYNRETEHIYVMGSVFLFINISRLSTQDVNGLKAFLKSNPISVWYELAEPITEQVDLPVIPSYYPFTNAWHDSEVEASDLTWNILARQYGSGQTTIKKDEAVLTELDLNTERTATPTTVKVQLKDTSGNTFYVETSADNVYLKGTDGSEISQQNLNDKIGQLINLVAFYSANPTTVLADLKKYITTIS